MYSGNPKARIAREFRVKVPDFGAHRTIGTVAIARPEFPRISGMYFTNGMMFPFIWWGCAKRLHELQGIKP
jgi:hypothetical protein